MKKEILAVIFELESNEGYSVLNLGGEFLFDVKSNSNDTIVLNVTKNNLHIKDYFGTQISNITALVGKNGKGKTSVLIDILKNSTNKKRLYILKEGNDFFVSYLVTHKDYKYLPLGKLNNLSKDLIIKEDNFENRNYFYFVFNQSNIQEKEVFYYTPLSNYSNYYNSLDFTSFYNDDEFQNRGLYLDLGGIDYGKRFRQIKLIKEIDLVEELKKVYLDFPIYSNFRFMTRDYLLQYNLGKEIDVFFNSSDSKIKFEDIWDYCSSKQDDTQFNYILNNTFIASLLFRALLLLVQKEKHLEVKKVLDMYTYFEYGRDEDGDNGSSFLDIINDFISVSTDVKLKNLLENIKFIISDFTTLAINAYKEFEIAEVNDFTCKYYDILTEIQIMFKEEIKEIEEIRGNDAQEYKKIKEINEYLSKDFLLFDTDTKLSFGQENMLNLFSDIFAKRNEILKSNFCFLLLDEVELGFHPEWKQKLISCLVKVLPIILPNVQIQILVTSHDPFMLSDLPTYNVVLLEDFKTFSKGSNTLGSNILELFSNDFYLKDNLIGEYSREMLEKTIKWLNNEKVDKNNQEQEFYLQIINNIGEPILRNSLREMWEKKFFTIEQQIDSEIVQLEKQIGRLKELKKKM